MRKVCALLLALCWEKCVQEGNHLDETDGYWLAELIIAADTGKIMFERCRITD